MFSSCVNDFSTWKQNTFFSSDPQATHTTLILEIVHIFQAKRLGVTKEWLQKREVLLSYFVLSAVVEVFLN